MQICFETTCPESTSARPPAAGLSDAQFVITRFNQRSSADLSRNKKIMFSRAQRKIMYSAFRQHWNIGVTRHPVWVVAGLVGSVNQARALEETQWMEEIHGAFRADPFAVPDPNDSSKMTILYEHYDWNEEKGRIDAVDWTNDRFSNPRVLLDTAQHLSYPFPITIGGDFKAFIPEHSEAHNVSTYTFDSGRASLEATIVSGQDLVDSTIVEHAGKFWLFATYAGDAVNRELFILHANSILGPWCFHSDNPVKSDLSNARPAGQFFRYKDALFRPAQNCSTYYGENIVINRIVKLSESEFIETTESEIKPPRGSVYQFGLHTLSHLEDVTVVDGARFQSKIHPALDRYSNLLRWS